MAKKKIYKCKKGCGRDVSGRYEICGNCKKANGRFGKAAKPLKSSKVSKRKRLSL